MTEQQPSWATHTGHTTHVCFPHVRCSCGEVVGIVSFALTGHEVEVPCPTCGEPTITNLD